MKHMSPYFKAGVLLTAVLLVLIIIGQFWTPYDPEAMSSAEKLQAPSAAHWMGTDNFGRDIFSRVIRGAGTTLGIALATVILSCTAGTVIGALTGYFGGRVDAILMRFNDALTAFPSILLGLVFVSVLGGGTWNVILALSIVFTPSFARVTRSAYASVRDANYIKSARLMGAGKVRILTIHILPNIMQVLLPALTIGFNNAVLAEASMSYLGIGSMGSLGYILSDAQSMLYSAPWYALCAGGTIVLMIFGVGLMGEGLQRGEGGRYA
ncbi:MAG: ABC transporter permease [Ruminococcaceae bacterium]|nr:ABC transporter permease [Oscillospiraceae bacterium]